jgi:hypothetical protein
MDDIRAFNYLQNKPVDVYATEFTQHILKREFEYVFNNTSYPVIPQINLHTIDKNNSIVSYDQIKSDVTVNDLNAIPVVKKSINIPSSYAEGSYRRLLFSLNKHDEIEINFYTSLDSSISKNVNDNKIKKVSNVTKPTIVRRSEQYGPNPLQHLFYMDFFDWRKYTTTYLLKRYNPTYIKPYALDEWSRDQRDLNRFGQSYSDRTIFSRKSYSEWNTIGEADRVKDQELQNEIDTIHLGNRLTYLLGRTTNSVSISSFLQNDCLDSSIRWKKSGDDPYFVDNTYILDIYFGLMEMHLRGFSWKTIMSIVDMIPQFHGDYFDTTYVNWKNLSKKEKDKIRFQQLEIGLKPIWDLIEKILINAANGKYY